MASLAGVLGGATGGGLPPLVQEVLGEVGDFTKKMNEVKAKAEETHGSTSSSFNKMAGVGKAAFLTLTAAGGSFIAESIKNAMEGQKAHALMTQAIQNAGGSVEAMSKKVEELTPRFAKLGFTNDELEQGMARLTQMTGSSSTALKDMGLAADVARARHMSLEEAATLVGKASQGNAKAFKQFGIELQDANGHTKTAAQLMEELRGRVQGSADAMSKTLPGKIAALRAEFDNLTERVGNWLIPKLTAIAGVAANVARWFDQNRVAAIALASVVGGVLTAALAAFAVAKAKAFLDGNTAGAIKAIGKQVEALGTAVTGASGAMGVLAGGAIIAGVAAVAYGIKKLADAGKESADKIDHLKVALMQASSAKDFNKAVSETKNHIGDMTSSLKRYHDELARDETPKAAAEYASLGRTFDGVDKAIAGMVKDGNIDAANRQLDLLAAVTHESRDSLMHMPGLLNDTTKAFQKHGDAAKVDTEQVKEHAEEEEKAKTPLQLLTEKVDAQTKAYSDLTEGLQQWRRTLAPTLDAAVAATQAHDKYTDSIDNLRESVAKNGPVWDGDSKAARDNRAALAEVKNASVDYTSALAANHEISGEAASTNANLKSQFDNVAKAVPAAKGQVDQFKLSMDGLVSTDPAIQAWGNNQASILQRLGLNADNARGAYDALRDAMNKIANGTDYIDPNNHLHRTNPGMLGRASGGPVLPLNSYVVGEKGPEILTMGANSGYITPNNKLGGGTHITNQVNVTVHGGDASTAATIEQGIYRALNKVMQSAVAVGRGRLAFS